MKLDILTKKQRHRCMSAIRNKNTKPEMMVRRLVHSLGYRYRLHGRGLPGKPDLIFTSRHKVIFVHGCFWHRHFCSKGRSMPSTRAKFWREKLEENKERDRKNGRKLRSRDWKVLIIWECWTRDVEKIEKRLRDFLDYD